MRGDDGHDAASCARQDGHHAAQVHGPGPFVVNYVNPSDAPAAKK